MYSWYRRLLLRMLLCPDGPPDAPVGDHKSVRIFRASKRYYYYQLLKWGLGVLGGMLIFLVVTGIELLEVYKASGGWAGMPWGDKVFFYLVVGSHLLGILGGLAGIFFMRLSYEMRFYVLTDRSLRIRWGVLLIQEQTISFMNIQNRGIQQGPLQRMFGIQDIRIDVAGGGAMTQENKVAQGHFSAIVGVDNAEEIDAIIEERLKGVYGAGLGGPSAHRKPKIRKPSVATPISAKLETLELESLSAILDEVKGLRKKLAVDH